MNGVKQVTIDPDIKLDERFTRNMPDDIKGRVLVTLTMGCEEYNCHWTELFWEVRRDNTVHVRPK